MLQSTDDLISGMGASLHMPDLRLDAMRTCQLVFDQRWVVTLVEDPTRGRCTFNCPLGPAGHTVSLSSSALYGMLQANFMGQGLAGCVLSIAQDDRAYIQVAVPLQDCTTQAMLNALELMLNQAEAWSERLTQGETISPNRVTTVAAAAASPSIPSWNRQRV